MFFVGIDVAKDKHDCFVFNSDVEVFKDDFTFSKDLEGFNLLLSTIPYPSENLKVWFEATGHYSFNLNNFLVSLNWWHQ